MPQIIEGNFTFDFPTDWVCKLDYTKFYREKMKQISAGKKAVDVVFNLGSELCFLEIKDYSLDLNGLKKDLPERLPMDVSQKWQNSISALVLAGRTSIPAIAYSDSGVITPNIKMRYYLLLETPPTTPGGTSTAISLKTHNDVVQKVQNLGIKLSTNLKPFGCPVTVFSSKSVPQNLPFTITP
jgi:hypothetical protein